MKQTEKAKSSTNLPLPDGFYEILPSSSFPNGLPISDKPPTLDGKIEVKNILSAQVWEEKFKRKWHDGLIGKTSELKEFDKLVSDYKDQPLTFTSQDFLKLAQVFYSKIAICKIDNDIRWGLFVRPGQVLKKGSLLLYSGILDFSLNGLKNNSHALAVPNKLNKCIALVDPTRYGYGGLCDLSNHGFTKKQLETFFIFKNPNVLETIATSNLQLVGGYYNGLPVYFLEVNEDILPGQQLLWHYSPPSEFLDQNGNLKKPMQLFGKNGQAIASDQYTFNYCQIVVRSTINAESDFSCLSLPRWQIEYLAFQDIFHSLEEGEYFSIKSDPLGYKVPRKLIKETLEKNPEDVSFFFAAPDQKNVIQSSTSKGIIANEFINSFNISETIRVWLNILLPSPDEKKDHWRTHTNNSKEKIALTTVKDLATCEAYYQHLQKIPNMKEKIVKYENQLMVGLIVDRWWSLYCQVPILPLPKIDTSTISSLVTLSITTAPKNKPPEAEKNKKLLMYKERRLSQPQNK